jgi:hypothetical protein
VEAAAVAILPCLRAEPELLHLEELKLVDVVFSFNFFVFFLVGGADFSLAVLESVVIVEVSVSVPKTSCPTCPESRELRVVADAVKQQRQGGPQVGRLWRGCWQLGAQQVAGGLASPPWSQRCSSSGGGQWPPSPVEAWQQPSPLPTSFGFQHPATALAL